MSTLTGLRQELDRRIRDLRAQIRALADAITAVNDKTRRGGGTLTFNASGSQTLDIVWVKPFPDNAYGIYTTLITTSPAQVHWTYAPITKTTTGVTVTVVAASAVGDVVVDVVAQRTT
jgi:hypothetical protein